MTTMIQLRKTAGVAAVALGVLTPVMAMGPAAAAATWTVPRGTVEVGALPAPPAGPGPGKIAVWQPGSGAVREVSFAAPGTLEGSSFYVAADQATHSLFVPTEAGKTTVLSTRSWRVTGSFASPAGSRTAKTTPNGRLVLIESGAKTVAYQTRAPYRTVFTAAVGGNAIVITPDGKRAFVGGNGDAVVTELALPSGHVIRTFPVGHSGDMAWAGGQVFSADIANGVMSVINPRSGRVTSIATPEADPNFSYQNMAAATAGFMQLAVSPNQRTVYAAGFSGHILKFSTTRDSYLGEVKVTANPATPNKLSGLDILPGGRLAAVTVENLDTTVVVSLRTGKVVTATSGLASNRWVPLRSW
ncbi:MAG TPA: hypothetical protein VFO01_12845 [Trebonia sp.]|nr:hypothetical protein [Trebonia sp.]